MPGVKVLLKGANKVVEFPSGMSADEIQSAISKTVAGAGVLGAGALGSEDAEAGVISRGGRNLIEAWHGTPHNVDKFSLEKIGTGEGAQVYGHGLYFADAKEVAEKYRSSPDGNLYKVEIDIDPYTQMLDWDKPLSEQPEEIINAFEDLKDASRLKMESKVLSGDGSDGFQLIRDGNDFAAIADNDMFNEARRFNKEEDAKEWIKHKIQQYASGKTTGAQAYGELVKRYGQDGVGQAIASNILREKGIKGIQYDDALLRGTAGGGEKSYTVFDDELIRIAEKNGIPVEQAKEMINPQGGYADINLLAAMGGAAGGFAGLNTEKASAQTANPLMPSNNMLLSIDQLNKLPSHMRPDVGSIQGPIKGDSDVVAAIQDLGGLLSKFEVPVLGNPVQGLAEYMQNFGYNDSEKERLKRAAMAVLDFL